MYLRIAIISTIVLTGIPISRAQDGGDQPKGEERGGGRGRFNRDDGSRERRTDDGQDMRQRFERFRNATPEERQKMMLDRMVDMTARNYELNDSEKEVVRKEMQTMSTERRTKMGADAAEYDRLREEMGKFWMQSPPANEQEGRERFEKLRNDPKFQELQKKLSEMDEKYPINWEESIKRVESVMPPDKVAKGHERTEMFRRGFEDRRRSFQQDNPTRRNESDSDARRDRGNRRRGDRARREDRGGNRGDPSTGATPPAPVAPAPVHPWEKYVQKFLADNDASANQSSAAFAILKDVRTRGEQIETSNKDAIQQAEKITDPAAKKKRLDDLNKPVNDLFEELKRRCDGILTAEQRAKKEGKRI